MDSILSRCCHHITQNLCEVERGRLEKSATRRPLNMDWNCEFPCDLTASLLCMLTIFWQIFYSAQTAFAYSVSNVAHGLANNSMTAAQRTSLSPSDPEYEAR